MTGFDAMLKNLKRFVKDAEFAAVEVSQTIAPKMEAYAKENRVWTDRTSHARQGLKGKIVYIPDVLAGCRIYHSVDYAEYLERIAEGKYAILEPTRNVFAGQFFDEIARRIMWRMGK
jgi:hypothetical protein